MKTKTKNTLKTKLSISSYQVLHLIVSKKTYKMNCPTSSDNILKTIGGGGYSKVYLVDKNGIKLSRKDIDSSKIGEEEFELIQNEVSLLEKMRDRNVIMYKSSFFNHSTCILSIYTEYFPNGDLGNELEKHRKSCEYYSEKVYIIINICTNRI